MKPTPTLTQQSTDAATAAVYSSIMVATAAFLYVDEVEDDLEARDMMRQTVKHLFNKVDKARHACRLTLRDMLSSDYYNGFAQDVAISAYREASPRIEELRLAVSGYLITKGYTTYREACRPITLYALTLVAEMVINTWIDFLISHPLKWQNGKAINARRVFTPMLPKSLKAAACNLSEYIGGKTTAKIDFRESAEVQRCINVVMETLTDEDIIRRAIDRAQNVAYELNEFYLPVKETEYKALDSGKLYALTRPLTPYLRKRMSRKRFNALKIRIGGTRYTRRYMLKALEQRDGNAVFLIGSEI